MKTCLSASVHVIVVAVAVISFVGPTAPAAAQSTGSIDLIGQSAWVDQGGIFDLQLRVVGADPDSTIELRVLEPWTDRQDFSQNPDGTGREARLEVEPLRLGELQTTSNEVLPFSLAVEDPDSIGEPDADGPGLPLLEPQDGPAVYPLEVLLRSSDGTTVDRLVTTMVVLPRRFEANPLQTLFVFDDLGLGPQDATEETESLRAVIDALDAHPDAPVALRFDPSILDEANADPEFDALLTRAGERLDGDDLLAATWVDVDEQAWIDAEMTSTLDLLYQRGAETLTRTLGDAPQTQVALIDSSLTASGLDVSVDRGAAGVIVEPGRVTPLDPATFPESLTTSFVIPTASGRTIPAFEADPGLRAHFSPADAPVLHANRLLADLALLALQQPDVRQAAVIWPDDDAVVDRTFLNVALSGIERIPILDAATAREMLTETAFTPATGPGTLSAPLRRELRPTPSDPLGGYRTDFAQARTSIDSWRTVIVGDPAGSDELESLLLRSADQTITDSARAEQIDEIYRRIDAQKDGAISAPAAETITFTSREATVPLIVENNFGFAADVALVFDSEKLEFPEGRQIDVRLEPGTNRIDVPVLARASGDSPIRIQVLSPDRAVLLSSSEVIVRTFAFSGVGVIIGVISIIVLLIWWLRHRRSTRTTLVDQQSAPDPESEDLRIGV